MKNPTWTRQETELLVNLYFDLKDKSASIFQANQEIEQLSTKLRSIAKTNGLEVGDTFRNYAGIKMKLANLLYIDTMELRDSMRFHVWIKKCLMR